MHESRVKILLITTLFIMTTVPAVTAVYFLNRALQTSLNLAFNPSIEVILEQDATHLRALKTLDPAHESEYRLAFGRVQDLRHIYSEPGWSKAHIVGPLRLYFGLGLATAVAASLLVAALLSRMISKLYESAASALLEEREKVRFLQQMSSWQDLARILAHEIKNPLTPIEVLVTSLQKAYATKPSGEFAQQLDQTQIMVGEELQHLKQTVGRFSEFARIPRANLIETDPAEVIGRILPAVEATVSGAHLQFNKTGLSPNCRARMDAPLFRQALLNIVTNGVEANPGRTVTFQIDLTATSRIVLITISNDGSSVPLEFAGRLFEPYVSDKASNENMGLGLAIVKKIVVEHDGQVAYSAPSGHPQFMISLPRIV